jgi:hypothetical protein
MPIIRPEISCNPQDLLITPPVDIEGRRWFAANTLARQEKSLARDLLRHGIPFYLPLLSRRLVYKGRSVWSYAPLYSGFVFLYANDQEQRACLATGRVAAILEIADQDGLRQDLKRIANALATGAMVSTTDAPFLPRLEAKAGSEVSSRKERAAV